MKDLFSPAPEEKPPWRTDVPMPDDDFTDSTEAEPEPARPTKQAPPRKEVGAGAVLETLSALELDGMAFREPRYPCAGLIVEGLSFLAGKPKLGKSWLDRKSVV